MSWYITLFQRTPRINYRVWKKKKNSEKDPKSKNTENQDPVIQQKIKKQYQVNINIKWKQTKILEPTQEDKNMKFEQKPKKQWEHRPQDDIWSLLSWAHVHCHVVLWTQCTIPDSHHPWGSCTPPNHYQTHTQLLNFLGKQTTPMNWKKKEKKKILQTLISLNGIKRLFSIFESSPSKRDAWRKLRLVAARAFIVGLVENLRGEEEERKG